MTTGAQLLRAICEDPANDVLRLVYADWLEENGEGLRGELIRVQVELAKPWTEDSGECWQCHCGRSGGQHTNGPCRCTPKWVTLRRRERGLLEAHGFDPDWFPVSRDWFSSSLEWSFHRGFVDRVGLNLLDLELNGAELFSAAPITEVNLAHKHPWRNPLRGSRRRWGWIGAMHWATDRAAHIPDPLHHLIYGAGPFDRRRLFRFHSREEAQEALSRACVVWGRQRAGLAPLAQDILTNAPAAVLAWTAPARQLYRPEQTVHGVLCPDVAPGVTRSQGLNRSASRILRTAR